MALKLSRRRYNVAAEVRSMRPILGYRMPTLATKATFLLPLDDVSTVKPTTNHLESLDKRSPSSLRQVRCLLASEIKTVKKKLTRLERAYYGVGKNLDYEVEKYVMPIKGAMRGIMCSVLSSAKSIEGVLKSAMDPEKYKGDPDDVILLKEVYQKVQNFVPVKFTDIVKTCYKMIQFLEKYCISFYDPERDGNLETAMHYEEQIKLWTKTVKESLEKIETLGQQFKKGEIHYHMLSTPVASYCQRQECESVPFLLLFADACTSVRTALSVMSSWMKSDENYASYLENDIKDYERQRLEQMKLMREAREKYHSAIFKLNQVDMEHSRMESEINNLREKKDAMEVEERHLADLSKELMLDKEFKEGRREMLQAKLRAEAEELDEQDIEGIQITLDILEDEIRSTNERHPLIARQLNAVHYKLDWIKGKRAIADRMLQEIEQCRAEVMDTEANKVKREAEYETIEQTLETARRLHLYKCSSDILERIFYGLPLVSRHAKQTIVPNGAEDTLDKACEVVIENVQLDWMNLYRRLPFFPKRGAETIEKDIACISIEGARGPKKNVVAVALSRWRRHHTRARVDDLLQGLKAIKRMDVVREIDLTLNPPPEEEEEEEYIPPDLDPNLIPHYRDVLKFDQFRASKRFKLEEKDPFEIYF
ncbi:hypothetical protein CHS0354_028357 [Potamilus streckersoni]|uniref:Death domain-containing protein n=1 Tax=Potamilus streckersoni TaxID=2493646 RepID=A0AAE0VJZ8_9BIVA|nr:hypothetical protein CHS0354_028357 [Potamilus streckersoni]